MKLEELSPELRAAGEALLKAWREREPQGEIVAAADADGAAAPAADAPVLQMKAVASFADDASTGVELARVELQTAIDAAARTGFDEPVDEEAVDAAIASAEKVAAVSGAVNPAHLVPPDLPGPAAARLLDKLAPSFDRSWQEGWFWTLKSERRAALLRNWTGPQLQEAIALAATVTTDAAGNALRRLLAGEPGAPDAAPAGVRAQATEWASSAGAEFATAAKAFRTQLARAATLQGFDHLLQSGFFGREREIDQLRDFVEQPVSTAGIPLLHVSGIGGSGKSTLLAQALRPLLSASLESGRGPLIVGIDFDRRCLREGAELELSFELSRQLALYYPQAAEPLARLRDRISLARARRGELARSKDDSAHESSSRHGEEFDWEAAAILRDAGARDRRLIIVLDTFEEWQREHHRAFRSAMGRVLDWLGMLQRSWDLEMRVVVSGRAPPQGGVGALPAEDSIELRALKRGDAVRMLEHLGVGRAASRRLARVAGGMPLSLKVAARYYLRLPEAERAGFLRDASAEVQGLSDVLRQGVLYRRFLEHIPDDKARSLAHPGLALRRVSAVLIREVLAQPCKLGAVSPAHAEDLLHRLAREVWLVEERGDELLHRPELRTVMLDAMRNDPEQASRIAAVHDAAARWYSEHARSDEDRAEALYHRLALARPEHFDELLRLVPEALVRDVAQWADDFPQAMRVQLLARSGQRLTTQEAAYLPPLKRAAWAGQQAEALVQQGLPHRALSLWDNHGGNQRPGAWYYAAAFQSHAWQDRDTIRRVDSSSGSLRYGYLLSFVSDTTHDRDHLRDALDEELARRMRFSATDVRLTLLEDAFFSQVLGGTGLGDRLDIDLVSKWVGESQLDATRYLRLQVIHPRVSRFINERAWRGLLASAFRPTPDFVSSRLRHLESSGVQVRALRDSAEQLAAAFTRGVRSSQALGTWSDRFAQAVMDDVRRSGSEHRVLADLLEPLEPDDPEWRVALRDALVQDTRLDVPALADQIERALSPWLPSDLHAPTFRAELEESPRKAWKRAIEYLDRCGALIQVISGLANFGGTRFREVAEAYLAWQEQRRRIGRRLMR